MKLYASGEDYLEAVWFFKGNRAWFAPLILPGTWALANRALAMR